MEMSPPAVTDWAILAKLGENSAWWPSKLPESLGARDLIPSGLGSCYSPLFLAAPLVMTAAGGLWESGIRLYWERGSPGPPRKEMS